MRRAGLTRMVPILDWAPRYARRDLAGDLAAGVTVAAMIIPQGMAYALLAGLPPEVGLYAATIPLLAYAVLGTSRQLAVGPVAIVSLLTASALGAVAEEGTASYLEAAALLALLVGAVSALLGVARLGFLTNLLSHPVLVGYTSAAAIIIGFSQAKHVFGVRTPRTDHFHEDVTELVRALDATSWTTVGVAAASIALLWLLRLRLPRVPGALVTVAAAIVAVKVFDLREHGVAVVGDIPARLPTFAVPGVDAGLVGDLLPTAVVIAMVGFLESVAVAKVYARRNRYEIEPNQELVALGAANVASGLFGGYPVTGGFSRTAVNASAGARTPLASVVTAALVLVALAVLTPLFHDLPQATLAAIVLVAVAGLFDIREMRRIAAVKRHDFMSLVFAFVATLALGVEWGIVAAAGLSLALIVVRMSRPHTAELGRLPGTRRFRNVERFPDAERIPGVAVLRIDVSLSYLNATFLKRRIERLCDGGTPLRAVVLDLSGVNDLDTTAEHALREVDDELAARRVTMHLASVKGPVRDVLARSGLAERLASRTHEDVEDAICALTNPTPV